MQIAPGQRFRLGGLVETGSVVRGEGTTVRFAVTDQAKTLPVTYTGVLPDLFREGQGVVAEGTLEPDGVFHADNVLAKHDENYMPPEVAKKLKAQGVWRGDAEAGGPMSQGKVN
jgi:cytochrome c-type biogenesis protein CcmE